MFFQISPVIRKKSKPVVQKKQENEEAEIEILSLAPFTTTPKILFDNVQVGKVQTRKILIQNPTSQDIDIFLTNSIPEDVGLTLSWTESFIARNTEQILELTWCPKRDEAYRYSITLSDGKRINRNIAITFKPVAPKQTKTKVAKGKPKAQNQRNTTTLPLKRKPISPTKKLQSSNVSPSKMYGACYVSPERYQKQHLSYMKNDKYISPKSHYIHKYRPDHVERISVKENKENHLSPRETNFLSSTARSFVSPSQVNFSLDDKRETYILSPCQERRETYILKIDRAETIFESRKLQSVFESPAGRKGTFTVDSSSNSPIFRDSLDSPSQILPLRERNLFFEENRSFKEETKTGLNFEHNLRVLDTFAFSPALSPQTNISNSHSPNIFSPERDSKFNEQVPSNSTFRLNVSSETYVKANSSSDFSGGTFVKETSMDELEDSPLSSKLYQTKSPLFLKPKSFDFATVIENNRNTIELKKDQNLSSIAEEPSIISECSFRIGTKRKSVSNNNNSIKRGRVSVESKTDWSKKGGAAFRVAKSSTGLNLKQFAQDKNTEHMSTVTETSVKTVIVQNPFLYANVFDPFMSSSIYCTEEWVEEQEVHFKKWLNVLLTPPEELDSKTEVDAAKIWQECKKKDVTEAPTKEVISYNYNVNSKLTSLRRQAQNLFRSKEINTVLQKVCQVVDSGKLSIREDKDLHLNLKLKSDIMSLILGYNPLWLRIGLETVYNEVIPLKSNSDANGLAGFLMEKFFKDPYLMKKHKTVYASKYASELKKFMLKKFLILVYFLDKAKTTKLIQHDPCLFCKNAAEKESKLVLTHFARETLSAVGDITKYLRCLGYTVSHQQSYIHEFDYAVKNLGVDLRDGVRLVKVMEILQMRSDLTSQLRVPAISRLQKVHNMQVAFNSLKDSGYEILYDISPKDIVDGHKENTLSFLWQIIYKYQAPLMVKSATTVQNWFRSLPVALKRMKLRRIREKRESSAKKIQDWFRRQKLSRTYSALSEFVRGYIEERKQHCAATKIQSFFKMVTCRKKYHLLHKTITKLQPYIRGWLVRNKYSQRITAAKIIQKNFRRYQARKQFLQQKNAAVIIQTWYRSITTMRICRKQYLETKLFVLFIEQRYLALKMMRIERYKYQITRQAAIYIQQYYRGLLRMRVDRDAYLKLKYSTMCLQRRYRAKKVMEKDRHAYERLKQATQFTQSRFRANRMMILQRNEYLKQKTSAIRIQQWYRATVEMKRSRSYFMSLQLAAKVILEKYRARKLMQEHKKFYQDLRKYTVMIQQRYRATRAMRCARRDFLDLKSKVVFIQSLRRANKLAKLEKSKYTALKHSVLCIQRRYRAQILMKLCRKSFLHLRNTATMIQRKYRAKKLMIECKKNYGTLRHSTIVLQRRYRAQKMMLDQKQRYQNLRNAVVVIQRRFRQNKVYQHEKIQYTTLRQSIIIVQRQFRAQIEMKIVRKQYVLLRAVTVTVQRRFRAQMSMKQARNDYVSLRNAAVTVQSRYRAQKTMIKQRDYYKKLRQLTTTMQQRYRAKCLGTLQRRKYMTLKKAALVMQRRYRAQKLMLEQKLQYQNLRNTTIFIQRRFRQNKLYQFDKAQFASLKQAIVIIQQRFRAQVEMRIARKQYIFLRAVTITVQRRFRAQILMKQARKDYISMKNASLLIQRRYRAQIAMKKLKSQYEQLRKVVITIQQFYRARKLGDIHRARYLALRNASLVIQRRYRARRMMLIERKLYQDLRNRAIFIQQRVRQNKLYQIEKTRYNRLRESVLVIQRMFRAKLEMQLARTQYIKLKNATVIIQRRYRAIILMRRYRNDFLTVRNSVLTIQMRYRAQKHMIEQRNYFQKLRRSILSIQEQYRARKLAIIQRTRYLAIKKSLMLIQSRYKSNKARKDFLIKYRAITNIQKYIRGCLVRKIYRPLLTTEAIEARRIFKIQNAAAVKIQSTWRGYSLRKSNIPVMTAVRKHKAKEVDASKPTVQARTLAQRCDLALSCMTNKNSSLLMIIKALEDLDFITRHCQNTCIRMSLLLPNQLYIILTSAARSRPEMIACNVATFILINFYKYSKTRNNSWDPEYLDLVFNVLLHWCDKEAPLFSTLCTLLWLFAHEQEWKQEIQNVPNIRHRLSKIQTLVQRKESMVLKTKRLANVASVFSYVENIQYPTRNANWGLDYNRPNTFTNAVFACNSLIKILDFAE